MNKLSRNGFNKDSTFKTGSNTQNSMKNQKNF